jgi:hypothetical protein
MVMRLFLLGALPLCLLGSCLEVTSSGHKVSRKERRKLEQHLKEVEEEEENASSLQEEENSDDDSKE